MTERNFLECKFSHDIVPYMYGELPASKCSVFESHLLDCAECTDEFAAISSARYEVYDWKKVEFDPLPTPRFAIPDETEAVGFAQKIRAVFGRGWAVPGLAFVGLIVLSVSAVTVLLSGDSGSDLVSEVGNANEQAVNRPVIAPPPQEKPALVISSETKVPAERRRAVLNASARTTAGNEPRRIVRKPKSHQRLTGPKEATVQAQQRSVPRLNGFPEDEDTSLRLAELFDDIDTRD